MPVITGIQYRSRNQLSRRTFADYSDFIECEEFAVKSKDAADGKTEVEVYFPRLGTPDQGVGLRFPSREIAVAVARAVLTVAEGHLGEAGGRFPT